MLKRIMIALAGLSLLFGLAAAPASGQATEELEMTVFSEIKFDGSSEDVDVPTSTCEVIPAGFDVLSVQNRSASNIDFFGAAGCAVGAFVGTVEAQGENDALDGPATHYGLAS